MHAPNVVRGYFYPTNLTARCPFYSQCTVTNKCQNYNRHNLVCSTCEERVRPAAMLGGLLAEGEYEQDVQLAMKIVRDAVNAPMVQADSDGQRLNVDMVDQRKTQEASDTLAAWMEKGSVKEYGGIEHQTVDAETAYKLRDLID